MHGWYERNFLLFKDKIMFKILFIKSNHRVLRKNKVWSTSFAPDYSATVLAAKRCINSHEHSK